MNRRGNNETVVISAIMSAIINAISFALALTDYVVAAVALYLAYQILGFELFMWLIVAPVIVALFYYGFKAYDSIMDSDWFDGDGGDDCDNDYDDRFNGRPL